MTDTAYAPRPCPTTAVPLGDPIEPSDRRAGGPEPLSDGRAGGPQPLPEGGSGCQQPPPGPPESPRAVRPAGHRRRRWAAGGLVVLLAVGGGAGGGVLARGLDGSATWVPAATAALPGAPAGTDGLTGVAAAVTPSIVTVLVDGVQAVEGSGVVVGADGLVVTNNHVVSGDGTVSVRSADGRTAPADVVGTDSAADLAVLRVRGLAGLPPVVLGTSGGLRAGDTVLAFGSPLGLTGTVTAGIVSAVGRDVDLGNGNRLADAVQTDAAINAGNSGGALVDAGGRLVGINVAIATTGEGAGSIGLGFAIPVDTVRAVVARLSGASS